MKLMYLCLVSFLLWLLAFSRLKIAIKREQCQACLGYAEREQFGRSQNGKLNSRGFSNPWNTSRFIHKAVCKDGGLNTDGLLSPRPRCRSASFRRHFYSFLFFRGFKNPRLFAFGFASCQTPCLCVSCLTLGGFDLCIVFNVWFLVCFALLRQWLTANGCLFCCPEQHCKDTPLFCKIK